jgi:hypothetical protein
VTKTKPQAPNHIVFIGVVARTTPNLGRIIYRITNGFELDELHNVFINGTLADKHTLYYDAATSLWKTNTIPAVLGYTPANKAGDTFTGSISATNLSGTNTGDQDLSNLVVKNTAITGATKTKITYDEKGLVTGGADATTADIADSLNKRYTTDAQQTLLGNTSNTNTGDETNATIKTKLGAATTSLDGYLTATDWTTFNSKVGGSGTTNYLPKFTATSTLGNSQIADNGTGVGIGITPDSTYKLYVYSYNTTIFSQSVFGNAVHGNGNIGVFGEGNTGMKANGINVGIEANAGQTDEFGVISETIGGIFNGNAFFGGSPAYSVQLKDGTEGIGKFLKSVTADGKSNWATLSATSPLSYNSGTDVFSIQVANATQSGYLSSTDWNTFNSATAPFIPSLIGNETYRGISINNNSTTVISDGGVVMSSSASTLAQSVSSTNFATKQIRLRYYASTVSGGRYTGTRGSALLWYIHGGFKFVCDFNISDTSYSAGCQQFYGLAGQITDLAYGTATGILVSTLINTIGVGSEVGDTNLQVFHNDATGTATKVDLGVDFPANRTAGAISTTVYSIKLYNECMSTDVKYEVKNNETGSIANGTISTNLPLTSQGLNFFASRCMSATSVTSTGQFDLSKLGVYSLL